MRLYSTFFESTPVAFFRQTRGDRGPIAHSFPAVGAQLAFWIWVPGWAVVAVIGLGWLIYFGLSKLSMNVRA